MTNFKNTFIGFFGFLVITTFCVSIGIVIYSLIENQSKLLIALIIFVVAILSAILCSVIDYIRRKHTIDKPVYEILQATQQMAKGNFDITLVPSNSYPDYNRFDVIKDNLNNMALELSKNEIYKSNFIANVSHEIKTPLSIIKGYAKMVKNPMLSNEEREKYLDKMSEAVDRLSDLITNILKLNKLENQKLNPNITNFNLSELLAECIVKHAPIFEAKAIEMICYIDQDVYINSEKSYLEIVFNNLISNAIKFTDNAGSITIHLKKINEEYIFSIEDTGCGIDNETGKHIFDKFYQGDTSHSNEGNGLGLALVKQVIDILGGKISVVSQIDIGTTFKVTLKGE